LPAHQHVEQKCGPELPAYRLLAVAEEVADLEGLLDLFEEDLDAPTRLVEFADAGGCPSGVVGYEGHHHFLAIDFDEHFHAAGQWLRAGCRAKGYGCTARRRRR